MFPLNAVMKILAGLIAAVNAIANAQGLQNVVGDNLPSPLDFPVETVADTRTMYVDGAYQGYEDSNHFATAAHCMTAVAGLDTAPDATHPLKIVSGLKTDGTLIDWSGYSTATIPTGAIVYEFNNTTIVGAE